VVAIALSGIVVILCIRVYLIFSHQFRVNSHESEYYYSKLLKVSSLEKMLQSNVYEGDNPLGEVEYISAKDWLFKIKRLNRATDSLVVTWDLNQYSRDSLYVVEDQDLEIHFRDLTEYEQDHLYINSISLELSDRKPLRDEVYFLYSDSPNLARIRVKDILQ